VSLENLRKFFAFSGILAWMLFLVIVAMGPSPVLALVGMVFTGFLGVLITSMLIDMRR
jgi:hypothetical protein